MFRCRSGPKPWTFPAIPVAPPVAFPTVTTGPMWGAQRRNRRDELLGPVPGGAPSATWERDGNAVPEGVIAGARSPA